MPKTAHQREVRKLWLKTPAGREYLKREQRAKNANRKRWYRETEGGKRWLARNKFGLRADAPDEVVDARQMLAELNKQINRHGGHRT